MLSVHSPNSSGEGYRETAMFYEIVETDGTLMLKSYYDDLQETRGIVKTVFEYIAKAVSGLWGMFVSLFAKITAII